MNNCLKGYANSIFMNISTFDITVYIDIRFETIQQTKIQAYSRQTNSSGHNICMYRIYWIEKGCLHTLLNKNLDKHYVQLIISLVVYQ